MGALPACPFRFGQARHADAVNLDANGGASWTSQGAEVFGGSYGGLTYNVWSNGSQWVAIEDGIVVNAV
ncbi:MAG: hypothetical protein WEC00_13935 [Dongiaceae bacterium]